MPHPLVSIITPSYNSAKFIAETIDSVRAQTFKNWELIIVDDCSTDGSVEIIKKYQKQDKRIRLEVLLVNSGPAVARNRGIELAQGRYIAFIDSDDRWLPEKLEKQIAFMQETGAAFSHCWYIKTDEQGKPNGRVNHPPYELTYHELLKSNRIGCLTVMIDIKKTGKIYMPLIRRRQDDGLWLALLKKTEKVYCLQEDLALYRERTKSISSNKIKLIKYNWLLLRDIEKLSWLKSLWYLMHQIIRKVFQP